MKFLLMAIGFLLAIMPNASAAVYQQGIVYVIYEETGNAAIKDKTDINSNGVPDMVEDIATQLNATREVFKDVFNFPDPLASERFKNVTSIEIDIAAKEDMEHNGLAFSGVRKNSKHDPNERAIHIQVANTVDPHKTPTSEHEYFHLIQYGATYFRNQWFLEGMARWSQDSVSKIKKYPSGGNFSWKLKNKGAEEKIFKSSYGAAEYFWYPLALNMRDKATIPDTLIKKYRYVDGSPVFEDNVIYGANTMREVLRVMKSKEDIAANEYGGVKKWHSMDGQRYEGNNKIILDCVREVYATKN